MTASFDPIGDHSAGAGIDANDPAAVPLTVQHGNGAGDDVDILGEESRGFGVT
ncbi:MAG: hypothetical protein ACRD1T_23830 [Acidimicrobiia bacterium]